MLYDKREIRLAIRVYNEIISAEKKYATFRSLFNSSVPLRLSAQFGYDVYVYDVDWGGESERVYFENNRGFIVTILLIETAPVKCVYSVTGAASFTLAAKAGVTLQPQVLVSWGDGTFTTSRNGAVTKTYTDGYTEHRLYFLEGCTRWPLRQTIRNYTNNKLVICWWILFYIRQMARIR